MSSHYLEALQPVEFYVIDMPGPAVVGLPTSEELDLVTINGSSQNASPVRMTDVRDHVQAYLEQFDKIGNFQGEAKLLLKDGATQCMDAPPKYSIYLKDRARKEGKVSFVKWGSSLDWRSILAFSTTKVCSIRICLDPQNLNSCHKIPTDKVQNPIFSRTKYFSKLDTKAGYWFVHLHEPSQLLPTFRTPFGRFCWRRLPFNLNVSQDIIQ